MLYGSHLRGEVKSGSEINGNAMRGYGLHSKELKGGLTNVVQRVCSSSTSVHQFNECTVDSIL